MTIVNALKKLVTAWGGSTTADTIADAIDDLSGITPSSLPEVSSTDNGNVLTVVEGSWAKAAPSGGASYDYEIKLGTETATLVSGSYADMVAKLKAGTPVLGRVYGVTASAQDGFYSTTEMCALNPFLNVIVDPPNPDTESLGIVVYVLAAGESGAVIANISIDWASDDTLTVNEGD